MKFKREYNFQEAADRAGGLNNLLPKLQQGKVKSRGDRFVPLGNGETRVEGIWMDADDVDREFPKQ